MALFALLVFAPAVLPQFGWFVATRLVAGALQGLFLAAAFTTATAVVPPERVGRALAVVIAGFSVSTVIGLPLGVLVGSVLGWREALLMVGGFALIATGLLVAVVPSVPGSRLSGTSGLRHALAPRVLADARSEPHLVCGARGGDGLSGPVARARHRSVRTAGQRDSDGVRRGECCGLLPGRPLADANAARALVIVTLGLVTSSAMLYLARSHPLPAVARDARLGRHRV